MKIPEKNIKLKPPNTEYIKYRKGMKWRKFFDLFWVILIKLFRRRNIIPNKSIYAGEGDLAVAA